MTWIILSVLLGSPGSLLAPPDSQPGLYLQEFYQDGNPHAWICNLRAEPASIAARARGDTLVLATWTVDSKTVKEIDLTGFLRSRNVLEFLVGEDPWGTFVRPEGTVPDMLGAEHLLPCHTTGTAGETVWLQQSELVAPSGGRVELVMWVPQGVGDFSFWTAHGSRPDDPWNRRVLTPRAVTSATLKVAEDSGRFTVLAGAPIRDAWMHRVTVEIDIPQVSRMTVFLVGPGYHAFGHTGGVVGLLATP